MGLVNLPYAIFKQQEMQIKGRYQSKLGQSRTMYQADIIILRVENIAMRDAKLVKSTFWMQDIIKEGLAWA